MANQIYRKGVYALIKNADDEFLIIQKPFYNGSDWSFIGGGADEGEDLVKALIREIHEETALTTNDYQIVGRASNPYSYDYPTAVAKRLHGGKYKGQSYYMFLVDLKSKNPTINFESREIARHKWVPKQSLNAYLNFPGQTDAVNHALTELNSD